MPTISQPAVKRMRLDDSQAQTQGMVMAVVGQYAPIICVVWCVWEETIVVISKTITCPSKETLILWSQIQHAVLSQVSPALIWGSTATSMSRFNFRVHIQYLHR